MLGENFLQQIFVIIVTKGFGKEQMWEEIFEQIPIEQVLFERIWLEQIMAQMPLE